MKLYIDTHHYNTNKINVSVLKNKFKYDENTLLEFYTENGIYTINNNEIYKLTPVDEPLEKIQLGGLGFIVDKSYYTKRPHYQLSPDHVIIQKNLYVFHNSKVKLLVEGDVTINDAEIVVSNFFFETHSSNELKDAMILNELNEFLSTFK
jgi:hypothetical protein